MNLSKHVFLFVVLIFVADIFANKSVAVLTVKSDQLKSQDCISITNFMTTELQKIPDYRIIAWDDVTKMLEHQAHKQALGCDDDKCFSEIGGALGVDFILTGDIGGIGDRFVMTIKLIDISKVQTVSSVSRKVKGNMGLLIDEIPGVVAELFHVPHTSQMQAGAHDGMVLISGGQFMMGSYDDADDEKPVHQVMVSGFFMDKTEVTQADYEKQMGNNPSVFKNCPNCPVENVLWNDAKTYCEKAGKRLPTEAEWEYACRAGTSTKYYWGNSMDGNYAWYKDNSHHTTQPVGQKRPNAFGLYDMIGNAWEWCSDWYGSDYYASSPTQDPQGPATGQYHVLRGGSMAYGGFLGLRMRSTIRGKEVKGVRYDYRGFRCVRSEK